MKIILINPKLKDESGFFASQGVFKKLIAIPAITLPYIAASTPSEVEVVIWDETTLRDKINFNEKPDLVGITVSTYAASRAYEIADEFRERGVKVVLGGYHPTIAPEEAKLHADCVVIGEGEDIWLDILDDLKRGKLKEFYKRQSLPDLKNLPIPSMKLIKRMYTFLGIHVAHIRVSRGCPHNCSFCNVPFLHGRKFRFRPVEEVINEIKVSGTKIVNFMEDNIVGHPEYAKELFEKLIPLKIRWISPSSITIANDPELLKLAEKSGCKGVSIGFESISKDGLLELNKFQNLEKDVSNIVRKLHEHGILVIGSFIIGLDTDDVSIFDKTINFIRQTNLDFALPFILIPMPQTEIYKKLLSEGRLIKKEWWLGNYYPQEPFYQPKLMTKEELLNGLIYMIDNIYSFPSIIKQVFFKNNSANSKITLLQKFVALLLNVGYLQLFREQKK
ncbi:MAG: radical SAM protein [bacterium]|nr:radical SAM protein [bacterium]